MACRGKASHHYFQYNNSTLEDFLISLVTLLGTKESKSLENKYSTVINIQLCKKNFLLIQHDLEI